MTASNPDRARRTAGAVVAGIAVALGWAARVQEPVLERDPWPDTSAEPAQELSTPWRHFGDTETPEWPEAPARPEAPHLELGFEAAANLGERALELRCAHVDDRWSVQLNETRLGELPQAQAARRRIFAVPPGALRDGANLLTIRPPQPGDDVTIGRVRLLERGYREALGVSALRVRVSDVETGEGIPARLTIQRADGAPALLHYPDAAGLPTREGVQYASREGEALLELATGEYRVHAMRGTEWGHAEARVRMPQDAGRPLALALGREVATAGWISADTHLHTYTFSGHGDATLEERMLTLAGEGVEVAIATDHNHQTDYAPARDAAGLAEEFFTIVGNEVTTEIGHFNAFPFAAAAPRPDAELRDYDALDAEIRARGAQVVILNHPRWPKPDTGPFGAQSFDLLSGDFGTGLRLRVDAIEVFNSTEEPDRWKLVLSDWFALRNAGSRASGAASSDSHTVGDPVGQGRTYFACAARTPSELEEADVVDPFLRGATTMSQGLFLEIEAGGGGPGDTVRPRGGRLTVRVRVAGASWAKPTRVDYFLDGRRVRGDALAPSEGPCDHRLECELELPPHDAWLVAMAQGPVPEGGWWTTIQTHLVAVSNPILLDGDGDGEWHSPREIAARLLDGLATRPGELGAELARADAAVATQTAVLWRRQPAALTGDEAREALCAAAGAHQPLLRRLLEDPEPR